MEILVFFFFELSYENSLEMPVETSTNKSSGVYSKSELPFVIQMKILLDISLKIHLDKCKFFSPVIALRLSLLFNGEFLWQFILEFLLQQMRHLPMKIYLESPPRIPLAVLFGNSLKVPLDIPQGSSQRIS